MAQISEAGAVPRTNDTRIISLVCAAHFVSHFYILVLPPLFPFVREFYGVSYTQLGLALTVFNIMTAVCQTPAGFLADEGLANSAAVVLRTLSRWSYLKRMAWLMPRIGRAVPYLGYLVVVGTRPA